MAEQDEDWETPSDQPAAAPESSESNEVPDAAAHDAAAPAAPEDPEFRRRVMEEYQRAIAEARFRREMTDEERQAFMDRAVAEVMREDFDRRHAEQRETNQARLQAEERERQHREWVTAARRVRAERRQREEYAARRQRMANAEDLAANPSPETQSSSLVLALDLGEQLLAMERKLTTLKQKKAALERRAARRMSAEGDDTEAHTETHAEEEAGSPPSRKRDRGEGVPSATEQTPSLRSEGFHSSARAISDRIDALQGKMATLQQRYAAHLAQIPTMPPEARTSPIAMVQSMIGMLRVDDNVAAREVMRGAYAGRDAFDVLLKLVRNVLALSQLCRGVDDVEAGRRIAALAVELGAARRVDRAASGANGRLMWRVVPGEDGGAAAGGGPVIVTSSELCARIWAHVQNRPLEQLRPEFAATPLPSSLPVSVASRLGDDMTRRIAEFAAPTMPNASINAPPADPFEASFVQSGSPAIAPAPHLLIFSAEARRLLLWRVGLEGEPGGEVPLLPELAALPVNESMPAITHMNSVSGLRVPRYAMTALYRVGMHPEYGWAVCYERQVPTGGEAATGSERAAPFAQRAHFGGKGRGAQVGLPGAVGDSPLRQRAWGWCRFPEVSEELLRSMVGRTQVTLVYPAPIDEEGNTMESTEEEVRDPAQLRLGAWWSPLGSFVVPSQQPENYADVACAVFRVTPQMDGEDNEGAAALSPSPAIVLVLQSVDGRPTAADVREGWDSAAVNSALPPPPPRFYVFSDRDPTWLDDMRTYEFMAVEGEGATRMYMPLPATGLVLEVSVGSEGKVTAVRAAEATVADTDEEGNPVVGPVMASVDTARWQEVHEPDQHHLISDYAALPIAALRDNDTGSWSVFAGMNGLYMGEISDDFARDTVRTQGDVVDPQLPAPPPRFVFSSHVAGAMSFMFMISRTIFRVTTEPTMAVQVLAVLPTETTPFQIVSGAHWLAALYPQDPDNVHSRCIIRWASVMNLTAADPGADPSHPPTLGNPGGSVLEMSFSFVTNPATGVVLVSLLNEHYPLAPMELQMTQRGMAMTERLAGTGAMGPPREQQEGKEEDHEDKRRRQAGAGKGSGGGGGEK